MDDQTSVDILDHETTDAGDEEHEISWPSSVSSVSSLIDDQICSETPDCGNQDTVEVRSEISWPSSVSSVSSLIDDQICSETPDCGNQDTVEVRSEISWPSSVSSVSSLIDDQTCSETPDCGNTFKPCEEEDGLGNENQRKPADPERTDPKTLAETSLTGFTSRSRDPDRTHPKGVVHDNNSDSGIEDSRDGESRQIRYNLQQDPDNTVLKVVIQVDELNHNIATSQHLTLRKDPKVAEPDYTYSKTIISVKDFDSGLEDNIQRQHVYLNNPDETHPKVVTGDCDSESMSEVNTSEKETIEPHRTSAKQDQTWVDGLTTEKTTGSFIYNYLIDQPVSSGLEANRRSYINTFKGEDREIFKQNENCLQDPDNTRPKSVIPVQHDNENCLCLIPVCTDPKETIPKAAIQDLLSEGESDSEDIACTTESLSPVLPRPDPSTITSGHSATDSGITTYAVLYMTHRIEEMCSLYRQAYESRNTRCNDKHALEQTEDLLQNLQKTLPSLSHRYLSTMLKNLALSDTIEAALPSSSLRYLSTILKNLTLADTIEAFDLRQRMQLLTEAIGSEFDRNTVQGSYRRGLGTEEGRPDVAEDSRSGVKEKPVPTRSQNDEGYILDTKQVSDRDSATHRSYFDEKENDMHLLNPDIKTGFEGKYWFDAENYIPSMNDLSGKAKDVADKSKTKYVSEKLSQETDPSNVITTEGPDSKLDPFVDSYKGRIRELIHPYESAPAQQPKSQSLEQEPIQSHKQGQNTSPLPQTQGRPDLSFGKEPLQLDGSDATLGREQTADVPGPPQEQDTVYQRYSLPAKLQDYYYERSIAEEMSESEQTEDDTHPQHSDQEFTHPHGHDSYQIPTKLQEYDASERSLDSGDEEITDIPQMPSVSAPVPYFREDLLTYLTDKVSQQHGSSQSTQLDPPVQPSTEVESDLPRTNMSEPVNFKELFSGGPAIDHAQPTPDEQTAEQTGSPLFEKSFPVEVPDWQYPSFLSAVPQPHCLFFYTAADPSGHTDASGPGPGTGDDASSKTKDFKQHHKEEPNTTKIICNDLEISEVRGRQRYINEESQDSTHRQRYNEGLSWDPERQYILDNRSVSGPNRDTTRNYQFEVYLKDGKDLIQESKLRTFVTPASIEEVSHGGEEEGGKEDEDEDIEEKVKQNEEL
ncbi:uro-adherence factor A-like [Haliotis cracherodii]|uniref:uro-adherence factor A-like n=1 Tax=Haliotis cracherodii TaxID=6455 RepID=UPI0039E86093